MCFENVFEKAFRFDFVMIHAGMYTKCLKMTFGKWRGVKSVLIEQAIKSLLPTQNGNFRVILLSFRIALSIPFSW